MGPMDPAANHRNVLLLKYPASWWKNKWREALPAGNGTIGASVYGAVQDETVLLNHAELWHGGRADTLPDVSGTLPQTRQLMDEGRYMEANWFLTNALKDEGYEARMASPVPLADLKLSMPGEKAFQGYRRYLDMTTGEITVCWKDGSASYDRRLFVSRADQMIVYRVHSDRRSIDAIVRLDFHASDNPNKAAQVQEMKQTMDWKIENEYFYYAVQNEDGLDYGAVLRIVAPGGRLAGEKGGIRVTETTEALILVKVFANSEREREWPLLKQELADVDRGYFLLLQDHVKLHGELFSRVTLELGNGADVRSTEELLLDSYDGEAPMALLEKLWAFGRYLYISATRENGLPMPLYGLWGGDYRLMWCHYMANENIQMMNWHAPVGGLAPLMKALFRHYGSLMDIFRDNARKLYGCRGVYIPAGTTPGIGSPSQIVPVILNWTGAAGWLARHYYDYYLFTGDLVFLQEEALPFMREAARFYEDFLIEGGDGYFRMYPSVSPENTPGNYMPEPGQPQDHPMPTTVNATMDFAVIKELFSNLIEGSRTAGIYQRYIPRWEDILRRIPSYQINEEGAIKEWMHPAFEERHNHRHLSHIYPVFPGQEFTREERPELFRAFEKAVDQRLIGAQTGWSMAHMASIYARLGDGQKALESLEILTRSCLMNNLFTVHNDWRDMGISMNKPQAPVQLDANLGITHAIQEMLIYVSPRIVKLMPAVPARWERGSVNGMRMCTGSVSFEWDRTAGRFRTELRAERATDVTVILPDEFAGYVLLGDDVDYHRSSIHRFTCHIKMEPGQILIIHNGKEMKNNEQTA
ncbi:glycoside hydrolase N-terminal domain-containing protein [Paenibacillus tarimensis]